MEVCRGNKGIVLLIHNLGTRWGEWSAACLRHLMQFPCNKRLGGPQSHSGSFGEKDCLLL